MKKYLVILASPPFNFISVGTTINNNTPRRSIPLHFDGDKLVIAWKENWSPETSD